MKFTYYYLKNINLNIALENVKLKELFYLMHILNFPVLPVCSGT